MGSKLTRKEDGGRRDPGLPAPVSRRPAPINQQHLDYVANADFMVKTHRRDRLCAPGMSRLVGACPHRAGQSNFPICRL